jgi:SAM-dependent methyltransferase
MKKIDYSVRAYFNEFVSEDSGFIRRLVKDKGIRSILEIPCANGRNLSVIGDIVHSAYFADINPKMVEVVQQKIINEKRTNCKAQILDMCDLSELPFTVDTILMMQQSIQLLPPDLIKTALANLLKAKCNCIVIDIYDFLSSASDYPKFLQSNNKFIDNDNLVWIRNSSSIADSRHNLIQITHKYKSENSTYFSEATLSNYSRTQFMDLCILCGYTISDYYTDYSFGKNTDSGRTILLLEN